MSFMSVAPCTSRRTVNLRIDKASPSWRCPATVTGLFLADFLQALFEIFLVFLAQLRVARAGVDLARFVFALVELLARPFVVDVNLIGLVHHLLDELRRDEIDAFL